MNLFGNNALGGHTLYPEQSDLQMILQGIWLRKIPMRNEPRRLYTFIFQWHGFSLKSFTTTQVVNAIDGVFRNGFFLVHILLRMYAVY